MNSPRLSADARREQILEVAINVFGRAGYYGASMNDIADAAGVTKPVLYQHFDSKHYLYLELISSTAEGLREAIRVAVGGRMTGREQLEAAFQAYFEFFEQDPGHFRVLYGEGVRSDPAFTEQLIALEVEMTAFTAELITIPSLEQSDKLLFAYGISGLLESSVRRWSEEEDRRDAKEVALLTAELVWRGLRGAGSIRH